MHTMGYRTMRFGAGLLSGSAGRAAFYRSFRELRGGVLTGSISGTVEDSQGALVSGAKVSAKQLATNREYTAGSTTAGNISCVICLRALTTCGSRPLGFGFMKARVLLSQ